MRNSGIDCNYIIDVACLFLHDLLYAQKLTDVAVSRRSDDLLEHSCRQTFISS
jgi:hypothetical protein